MPRGAPKCGIPNPDWAPGKPRKICGASKAGTGPNSTNICKMAAGYRTDHSGYGACLYHGGRTPSVAKSAANARAVELGKSFIVDTDEDVDPIAALLGEVTRTAGHVSWLSSKISMWTMDTEEVIPGSQMQWLHIYQYERRHLATVSEAAIKAGVAQRQVTIAEQQGSMLADAISAILDAMQLSVEQKILVPTIVPQILRSIATRTDKVLDS